MSRRCQKLCPGGEGKWVAKGGRRIGKRMGRYAGEVREGIREGWIWMIREGSFRVEIKRRGKRFRTTLGGAR